MVLQKVHPDILQLFRHCLNIVSYYNVLLCLVGSMGLMNNIRSFIWINVQQYTSKTVQVQLFNHLHSLSLRWHLSRKTGEVIRMVDRGVTSIDSLLRWEKTGLILLHYANLDCLTPKIVTLKFFYKIPWKDHARSLTTLGRFHMVGSAIYETNVWFLIMCLFRFLVKVFYT